MRLRSGWIFVDEYYETQIPWQVPSLDEIDGSDPILHPVMIIFLVVPVVSTVAVSISKKDKGRL